MYEVPVTVQHFMAKRRKVESDDRTVSSQLTEMANHSQTNMWMARGDSAYRAATDTYSLAVRLLKQRSRPGGPVLDEVANALAGIGDQDLIYEFVTVHPRFYAKFAALYSGSSHNLCQCIHRLCRSAKALN